MPGNMSCLSGKGNYRLPLERRLRLLFSPGSPFCLLP